MFTSPREAEILGYYERAVGGHVFIRETLAAVLDALAAKVSQLGGRARILELGSHAGFLTRQIVERWPELEVVVWDADTELVKIAEARLAGTNVTYHSGPLPELSGAFDLALSVARHHHLPEEYLQALAGQLRPGGAYLLADELCPEYVFGVHRARIDEANLLQIAGGYVFTNSAELAVFREQGQVPEYARELESQRKRALWRWYRYVVDEAIERGYYDIAVSELQSTHDDLITGSDAEHKFSATVVEKQVELAGFERRGRRLIGDERTPELQSMFVFEFERAAA